MKEHLQVSGVGFSYGRKDVLSGMSFRIGRGETLSLLGPNGCGKTTLSKIVLGLLRPKAGSVAIDGRDLAAIPRRELARAISYVPQLCGQSPSYRVLDMVLMGRIPYSGCYGAYSKRDIEAAWAALERLRLAPLASSPFNELSGGQCKLVLIARALAQEASLCVMDEPESGLDYGNQLRLFKHLASLSSDGVSFIITTHHPDHALWTGGRVLLMRKDGSVLAEGPAKDCIDAARLMELYEADVEVGSHGGLPFCLPRFDSPPEKAS